MTIKGDPLSVLLDVRAKMDTNVDEDLIKACYQLQNDHQYDKDRNTIKQIQKLVEATIANNEGDLPL